MVSEVRPFPQPAHHVNYTIAEAAMPRAPSDALSFETNLVRVASREHRADAVFSRKSGLVRVSRLLLFHGDGWFTPQKQSCRLPLVSLM